jgi:phosphate transport system permease protein
MERKTNRRRRWEQTFFVWLMRLFLATAALILGLILFTITRRGLESLSWEMISQPPDGDYYVGGGGGILNAILGSIYLGLGATVLSLSLALPLVLYLHGFNPNRRVVNWVRLTLDVMWGIPSIVYGAFGFALMIFLGLRASLLAGILTLALVVLPILARTLDEVMSLIRPELKEVTLALGTTRLELVGVLLRQSLPGLLTGILLAFSRSIGDAAAVLFTAGYTNNMPTSLLRPVASLPLAVFFQLGTPFPAVQARAHAAALILTIIILTISLVSQFIMRRVGRHVIR